MNRSIMTAITVGLLTIAALATLARAQSPNQSAEDQATLLKQLSAELKQLRLEVIQQAIEFQNWKIQRLERERQPLQSERQRLGEQEQDINQLITELEKYIGNATPAQEGKAGEMEAVKADLAEKGLKELSIKQQLVVQRETELAEQLEQEQQRLQELMRKAKKLRADG